MVRHGRRFTTFAILWAALQMALPTGLSFMDALLARQDDPTEAVVHVEETSRQGCRPVHSTECTICRDLSHLLAVGRTPPALAWIEVDHTSPSIGAPVTHARVQLAHPSSRAPPVG